jgi:MYXO-CTERM domain-containing protein
VTAYCGDAVIDSVEIFDDGGDNSDTAADACRKDRLPASCGDGVLDANDLCDDGNADGGDGCDATCNLEPIDDHDNGQAPEAAGGCSCEVAGGQSEQRGALFALLAVGWLLATSGRG